MDRPPAFRTAAGCVAILLSVLTLATAASRDTLVAKSSPSAVKHIATPYVYQPDPNAPDASVPVSAEIDDSYEQRARARRAQQIMKEELEEKYFSLYGVNVGKEARCVNSDPGDPHWKNPLPKPFDPNTTDPIALTNEALRKIVRMQLKAVRKANNGRDITDSMKMGLKDVHAAAVIKPKSVKEMASSEIVRHSQDQPTYDEQEGLEIGTNIEHDLVKALEKEDEKRKIDDARETQKNALIVEEV